MEPLVGLIVLSMAMLIGSYFFGTIPMFFNFSENKIRLLTIFGAGILAGTALSVIIPEGVNSVYSAHFEAIEKAHLKDASNQTHINHLKSPHSVIGMALVCGFVFMLLIDQISSRHTTTTYSSLPSDTESGKSSNFNVFRRQNPKITATIGLVVHAAADGVALGAAATTAHEDVEMIVFFAIMFHKAPASFGLVTFLLHEGLERQKIKKHLLIFALSAPLATLMTYLLLLQTSAQHLHDINATGMAMIFSGGTFLYVASVHVIPEIIQGKQLRLFELFCIVSGCFLPSMLTFNHHH